MLTQESTARTCPFPVVPPTAKFLDVLKAFVVNHKYLVTVGTMAVSIAAYAPFFGIAMAISLTVLILAHELGHILALQKRGYAASSPVFVPFLGAIVFFAKIDSRDDEAFIAYAGPLVGGAFAILLFEISLCLSMYTGLGQLLFRVGYIGVVFNLINLLPLAPLDGGAVVQAIGSRFKFVGLVALAMLTVWLHAPAFLFIWILVVMTSPTMGARLVAVLATLLWVMMIILIFLSHDGSPISYRIIISTLTMPFVVWSWRQGIRNPVKVLTPPLPPLPLGERICWLVLYLGLTALLAGVLITQRQLVVL